MKTVEKDGMRTEPLSKIPLPGEHLSFRPNMRASCEGAFERGFREKAAPWKRLRGV